MARFSIADFVPTVPDRDLGGAVKAWAWLALSVPTLLHDTRRNQWARTAGVRLGGLAGSIKEGVFFP